MKTAHLREGIMQAVFTACACISILAVVLICVFLFANGLPTIGKIGPLKFLLGTTWKPGNDIFGILPMILGSIYVTAGAILVGVPIGLLTAIYMSKFASPRINKVMLPAVQLLAGIPSVVYGFFGMIVLVPAVQAMVKSPFFKTVLHVKSGKGMSLFTAAVLLGIMILPTIIAVVCPIVVGLILGYMGVVGMLAGATVTGFLMAIYMANAGGAWDNAKKYIEAGHFGGKGSDCHKAGVVGDTVGDPFKDTSGPAINILIKLLSMVSIVFAGLVVNFHLL